MCIHRNYLRRLANSRKAVEECFKSGQDLSYPLPESGRVFLTEIEPCLPEYGFFLHFLGITTLFLSFQAKVGAFQSESFQIKATTSETHFNIENFLRNTEMSWVCSTVRRDILAACSVFYSSHILMIGVSYSVFYRFQRSALCERTSFVSTIWLKPKVCDPNLKVIFVPSSCASPHSEFHYNASVLLASLGVTLDCRLAIVFLQTRYLLLFVSSSTLI